jgi:hypothetical protein
MPAISKTSRSDLCQSSEQYLEFLRRDPNDFLPQLVTMEENWLCHYDRKQSKNQ